jgi:RHS repeat-associated protein
MNESVPISNTQSAFGPTIPFMMLYSSYNADGSRAQVDTGMGYGWTHTYNIFLFSQLGSMFRYDDMGRVTRYRIGPGGTYVTANGYFETLVKNPDGSFTITTKDKTVYRFESIPNTPFLVGGPVWRLVKITDRNNNVTTVSYTTGDLTSVTDTYGRVIHYTYNVQHRLISSTDPGGRITTFTYDTTGKKLTKITDPIGNSIQYSYDINYRLISKIDKDGRTFTYFYQNGLPESVRDSANQSSATLSNPNNWATNSTQLALNQLRVYTPSTTTNTDGRGSSWQYQYDANGYVTKSTAPDATSMTYVYDPNTLMIATKTDANGHVTSYQYDSNGNLTRLTDALGHVTTYTYEPTFNQMTSMTDPRGRVTTWSYDANGNRVLETDPLSQTRHWTYDSHGNVLTETDKNGNITSYNYDSQGNRIKMTDALSNVTNMTYDSVGNMLTITDANGHTTTSVYDGLNRRIQEIDATNHTTSYTFDGEGNRTQITDRNSHATVFQYDLRQRLIKVIDPAGQADTYLYDGNDNRVSTTDRNSHTTTSQYDVQNRLIQTTDALGGVDGIAYDSVGNVLTQTDANLHTTTYTYDALNRRLTMTDAIGEVTQYGYDTGTLAGCSLCGITPGSSQETAVIDGNGKVVYSKYDALDRLIDAVHKVGSTSDTITPADAVIVYTYDPYGNNLTVTEPNGLVTTYLYDPLNRRITETNPAGDVTSLTYDAVGNVATASLPNGNIVTHTYDPLNRLTTAADGIGALTSYTYDPVGNRLSETDGNGNTTSTGYDVLDRMVTTTDALSKSTTYLYDFVGNLIKITDRNGNPTTYQYDSLNRRTSTTDSLGNATLMQYDSVGNLIEIIDADAHATQYSYDVVDRPNVETYADGKTRTFTYDAVGSLTTRTDQIGQTTTYSYNDLYFLTGRSYPSGTNDTFTYDLSGRVLTANRGSWPVTFSYDGADRIVQTTQNGRIISYSYDIPGRTRSVTYPGGRSITEQYDLRTRLGEVDDTLSPPPIAQYTYDLGNRVVSRADRNGSLTAYTYNANNWVTSLEHSFGGTRIAGFGYDYDGEQNKKFEEKRHDTTHSEAYQYDTTNRLIKYLVGTLVGSTVPAPSTQTTYSLDPVGNWTSKTTDAVTQNRVHDSLNELTQLDAQPIAYDFNGNMKNDGAFVYAYDEENRIISATRVSDSAVVGQYQYDALGRRVERSINPVGSPVTVDYFYDGVRLIEEQTGGAATVANYVYGNFIDEILQMQRGGQFFYYHHNELGTVSAITDSSGAAVERYTYDAYGAPNIFTGAGAPVPPNAWGTPHSAIGNPSMFTGRELDEETGLYYFRARYYDTAKGRFLERDPEGYVNGMNLYEYANDNPTRFVDPFGRQAGPYANMSREDLLKLYEPLAAGWARLDTLSKLDPNGDFARRMGITGAQIEDAKKELQKMKEIQKELDRRKAAQQAAKNCPRANPCQVYWEIMAIAGEYDVVSGAIGAIEAVATVGTLGTWLAAKPATEGGKKLTWKAVSQGIKEYIKKKYAELPEIVNLKAGRALLDNVLDPVKACAALAECETKINGSPGGGWQRLNAFGWAIRTCAWGNGKASWYRSGVQAGETVASLPVFGVLFGRNVTWDIGK